MPYGQMIGQGLQQPGSVSSNSSSSTGTSQSSTQMLPQMLGLYNQLLGLNTNRYQNVMSAFTNGQQALTGQLPGLYQGYDQLHTNVMNTLGLGGGGWGVAAPAAQEIARSYANQRGTADQQLINAGLGNTTVRSQAMNQLSRMQSDSYGALGAQLASTAAGYQNQIGLARQNAMLQGMGMQNQLSSGLGGALAGMNFANTAGNLTGQFSSSNNASQSMGNSQSYSPGGGGGGGGRGGSPTHQSGGSIRPIPGYGGDSMGYAGGYAGGYSDGYGSLPSSGGYGGIYDPTLVGPTGEGYGGGINWSQLPSIGYGSPGWGGGGDDYASGDSWDMYGNDF